MLEDRTFPRTRPYFFCTRRIYRWTLYWFQFWLSSYINTPQFRFPWTLYWTKSWLCICTRLISTGSQNRNHQSALSLFLLVQISPKKNTKRSILQKKIIPGKMGTRSPSYLTKSNLKDLGFKWAKLQRRPVYCFWPGSAEKPKLKLMASVKQISVLLSSGPFILLINAT